MPMKKAFMVLPFHDELAGRLFQLSTKRVCEEFGLEIRRADEIFTTNPILDDIIDALEEASVIIADISGRNSNVLYELGMAHMLKRKQTVMITRDGYENVPFDVSHFRIIRYENTISGKASYEDQLRKTLKSILRDYRSIFKEEFEIILRLSMAEEPVQSADLYALMSLKKTDRPLKKHEILHVEGHNEKTGDKQAFQSIDPGIFSPFMNWSYVQESGDYIVLTEKGKAFVEFLEERGFVCDFINGTALTKGYVPSMPS
jgi:hypothetical protein